MTGLVHWTRPLRDGGVEFYLRAGGTTMHGSARSPDTYRELLAVFEQHVGTVLPAPLKLPPRGRWAHDEAA